MKRKNKVEGSIEKFKETIKEINIPKIKKCLNAIRRNIDSNFTDAYHGAVDLQREAEDMIGNMRVIFALQELLTKKHRRK